MTDDPAANAALGATQTATEQLVHELTVHQIELLAQNEELRTNRAALELARARYFELYDLAPVGYCTIDTAGTVVEANLTLADLLGVMRGELVGERFARFVAHDDQDAFLRLRRASVSGSGLPPCELRLMRGDRPFHAQIASMVTQTLDGAIHLRTAFTDVTTSVNVKQELADSRAELRRLATYQREAAERERGRIAREIHDEVGQAMTVVKLGLGELAESVGDDINLLRAIRRTLGQVNGALDTVRRLQAGLRPATLLELGLREGLLWLTSEAAEASGLTIDTRLDAAIDGLNEPVSLSVFRVAQESLTNAMRHAKANRVELTASVAGAFVELWVRDDGVGSGRVGRVPKGSFGILGMRERAVALGGTLAVDSQPNAGTTVHLRVPLVTPRDPERISR